MNTKHLSALVGVVCLSLPGLLRAETEIEYRLSSPDKQIEISIDSANGLSYSVRAFNQEVLQSSDLRLELADGTKLGKSPKLKKDMRQLIDETWKPVLKENEIIRDHANELVLDFLEGDAGQYRYQLVVRAYNDGIAFRYVFPEQDQWKQLTLAEEKTDFYFTQDFMGWIATFEKYTTGQEEKYPLLPLSSIKPASYTGIPLLVKISETCWAAVSEAALEDYAGMYLEGVENAESGKPIKLTSLLAGENGTAKVNAALPHHSPWRVILLGQQPGDLIESELILTLNEPSRIKDTSWIQCGVSSWDHWWSGNVKMETEVIKEYIDFAAEMQWPFQLIDWKWYGDYKKPKADPKTVAPQVDMDAVRAYAQKKGVRLWLWMHSYDLRRQDMDEVFALYQSWGIAGIKVDFMDNDDQAMVNWYRKVLEKAAKYELMVNFHGSYKPTGMRRTYPNLMTREGVYANEHNRTKSDITPEHNLTLPFTRGLAGPMDYTPGGFVNRQPEQFKKARPTQVMGTRCHELAKFVVYYSPLVTMADHPKQVLHQPGADFLIGFPTQWDETRVLSGYPGEHIVVARRIGRSWYIGGMSVEAREHDLPLSFLEEGTHKLEKWADMPASDQNATRLKHESMTVHSESKLQLKTVRNGGFVLRITPE